MARGRARISATITGRLAGGSGVAPSIPRPPAFATAAASAGWATKPIPALTNGWRTPYRAGQPGRDPCGHRSSSAWSAPPVPFRWAAGLGVNSRHCADAIGRAAAAPSSTDRTMSAAGRTSSISPTVWPANGMYSSPRPRRSAASTCGDGHRRVHGVRAGGERVRERRAQHARLGRRAARPVGRGQHPVGVGHLHRVDRIGGEDPLLPARRDRHLAAGQEARAHHDAGGAERERGGQPAAVGDPAGGDHRDVPRQVDQLRDEHHRRDEAAVAAGLAALGDEDVGAGGEGLLGLGAVDNLLHPADAGVVCAGDQVGAHARGGS